MASSRSIKRGQFPITCQLCETGGKIQWKCMDCELLMCQRCYDKIHPKFKNAKDHKIEEISQVGKKPAISSVQLKVTRKFKTDLKCIHHMCSCPDGSVWISDAFIDHEVLCRVKFDGEKLQVVNKFDMEVYGIAIPPLHVLFTRCWSKLQQFNETTGQIMDSKYNVSPLRAISICLSNDNKIIVGAVDAGYKGTIPFNGRRALVIMDLEGRQILTIEHDKNNKYILSYPTQISCTKTGNIFVVDVLSLDYKGNLVVIGQEGAVLRTYNGHPDLNAEAKPFKPTDVAVSPSSDSVIVCEMYTGILYIFDNSGNNITIYNMRNIGIEKPYSIAFSNTGKLLIGNSTSKDDTNKANLYEIDYTD